MGKPLLDWKDKEWVYDAWCNGYTQAEIAEAIGCDTKTIQRFLCKKQKIKKPLVYDSEGRREDMSWRDSESGKKYSKKYYEKNRTKLLEARKEYAKEHRDEINERRRRHYHEVEKLSEERMKKRNADRMKYYYRKQGKEVPEESPNYAVTKEEWLERYGYPMGDTTGWEHWLKWDNRIRRSEE